MSYTRVKETPSPPQTSSQGSEVVKTHGQGAQNVPSESEKGFPEKFAEAGADAVRQVARTGTRAYEVAVGAPGNILKLFNDYIAKPVSESITGKPGFDYEDTYLGKVIPTSSQIREQTNKIGNGYLKPRNKLESFADDLTEDVTALLLPTKLKGGGKVPFVDTAKKAFFIATGANIFGKGIEGFTGSEEKGKMAKTGAMFALSLFNKPGAAKYAGEQYNIARQKLPLTDTTEYPAFTTNLKNLRKRILAGRKPKDISSSEKFVIDEIDKGLRLVKDGKMNVNSTWAAKRALNEELSNHVYANADRTARSKVKTFASEVAKEYRNVIEHYGKTQNPAFLEPFKNAENSFGSIAQSNFMSRWVDRNVKHNPVTAGLLHMYGAEAPTALAKSFVPYHALKIGYRIWNSPALRKHYLNSLKSAARDNIVEFNKELDALDAGIQKEEKKTTYSKVN
jgi:hypothetical protein